MFTVTPDKILQNKMSAKCFGILTPGCSQQRTSVPRCQLLHFSAAIIMIQMKHQEVQKNVTVLVLNIIMIFSAAFCLQSMFEDAALLHRPNTDDLCQG